MSPLRLSGAVTAVLILLLLPALPGCGGRKSAVKKEMGMFRPLPVKHAAGFRLDTATGMIRATVVNPWQGEEKREITYRISKAGRIPPGKEPATVQAPVRRVVCTSTTHVAFLTALGKRNSIVGISGKEYVCDTLLREKIERGEIKDIGYDRTTDYETILQLHPDVVFLYGIGPAVTGTVARLSTLGIPAVIVGDYLEATPLGRAEWIRFFGAFFGMTEYPSRWTDSVSAAYDRVKAGITPLATPQVMTGLPWHEIWYVSGGKSLTATFIRDAGGKYVWDDLPTADALPMDIEKVFRKARDTDIWINCGNATSLKQIIKTDKRLALFQPLKNDRVYNNDARRNGHGGNDYWESGVVHPDIILQDLQKIFRGEEKGLVYYRKLK